MSDIEVSVIIATKNRPAILSSSVAKALDASQGLPVEIIIVNDGDPLLIDFEKETIIKVFKNPLRGVTSARNYGVKQSNGRILFFVDDDMWINKSGLLWILENVPQSENEKSVFNLNWEYPTELQKTLLHSKVGRYILANNYNTMWGRMHVDGIQPSTGSYRFFYVASCSLVMCRNTFDYIGGYNEEFVFQGEDIELSNRLNKNQIPIFCVFDVILFHNHSDRLNLGGYLERESRGYESQFNAEKMGFLPKNPNKYLGPKRLLFRCAQINEQLLISIINFIPESKFFFKLNNILIGTLSSLQRFKGWRKVFLKI